MKFQVIASGSAGNMTYIEAGSTKILLDCGIGLKEIERRSEVNLASLDAILITHEHNDHISNLASIAKKVKCKIYMNEESYHAMKSKSPDKYEHLNVSFINANESYKIKDIRFMPLKLSHDTVSCYGYFFVSNKEALAYIADTGFVPIPYIELLKKADTIILESNHDIGMLEDSDRPWMLKQRILSVEGHMSNVMAGDIINRVSKERKVNKVVLAHLSRDCNTPELAIDTIMENLDGDYIPRLYVAKQDESLPMLEVKDEN